jgi:F-type H+-transporting ATPase subunit b
MLNLDLSSVLAAVGAVSEAKQPGMIDFDYSFLFQLVNFIIAWIVLNLILIKPIRGIIAKRQELMSGQMKAIETFSADAATKLRNYESALDAARKVGAETRNKLKDEGTAAEAQLLADTGKKAAGEVADARVSIESEVKAAKAALKSTVDTMARKAAGKVLGQA